MTEEKKNKNPSVVFETFKASEAPGGSQIARDQVKEELFGRTVYGIDDEPRLDT